MNNDTSSKTAPAVPEGVDADRFACLLHHYTIARSRVGEDDASRELATLALNELTAYVNDLLAQQREAGRRDMHETSMALLAENNQLHAKIVDLEAAADFATRQPAAAELMDERGIRGPLTDAQKDHAHCLYRTLNHLGPDAAEDVIRYASVCGYVNGRKDFEVQPVSARPSIPTNDEVCAEVRTRGRGNILNYVSAGAVNDVMAAVRTLATRQPVSQSAPFTADEVVEALLVQTIIASGARMLRNGRQMPFSLEELATFANDLYAPESSAGQPVSALTDERMLLTDVLDAHDCDELEYIDGDHTEPTERFSKIVAKIRALVKRGDQP